MLTVDQIKKWGIAPEDVTAKEDGTFEVDDVMTVFQKKQRELASKDPEIVNSIKDEAKKEGLIIAAKKHAKTLKAKFGLEFSNSELEAMDFEQLAELAATSSKAANSKDVSELQQQIIDLAKQKQEIEESFNSKVSEIESTWRKKQSDKVLEAELAKLANDFKPIVPTSTAIQIFKIKLQERGLTYTIDDNGAIKFKKGDLDAQTEDKTRFADLEYLATTLWDDIKQKSNGSGGGEGNQLDPKIVGDKFVETEKMKQMRLMAANASK